MPFKDRVETFVTISLIIGISVTLFWPFRGNYFSFDDFFMLEQAVAGPLTILKGFNSSPILRVVTNSLLWPMNALSGYDPFGYNLFSLILYSFNAILFFFFSRQLFEDSRFASCASILFAATAVGCDAVLWKAAYGTLLNVTFYLLALIVYVRFRRSEQQKYYWLSVFIFLFAVLSKEESASFPFVIAAMELLVFKNRIDLQTVKRLIPFCLLIIAYLAVNYILIYHVFKGQSELVRSSGFQPLRMFLAPWAAFFLSPDGFLDKSDPRIYLTVIFIAFSLYFIKDRKLFLFALGWIFLTFLPQSLTTISQFDPKYIVNSLSRHLYLPSAGVSLAFAFLIKQIGSFMPARAFAAACFLFLSAYVAFNYSEVQKRGKVWAEDGIPAKTFLSEVKRRIPYFPKNSYVYIIDPPAGRAFVQAALRAFYMNPSITWIVDPNTFAPRHGMSVYLIACQWNSPLSVNLEVNKVF